MQVGESLIIVANPNKTRVAQEIEKINFFFGNRFTIYGTKEAITSVKGTLRGKYTIEILVSNNFPYEMPKVYVRNLAISRDCPHFYFDNSLCYMHPNQWDTSLSIAFVITKAAIWLAKYENWVTSKIWLGNHLSH